LQHRLLRELANLRAVGCDDDAAQTAGATRMFKRIRNHRPAKQRQKMLIPQPLTAAAREDDAENVHVRADASPCTRRRARDGSSCRLNDPRGTAPDVFARSPTASFH